MTSRWADAAGYEIYVPSIADADGDGWVDPLGIKQRGSRRVVAARRRPAGAEEPASPAA